MRKEEKPYKQYIYMVCVGVFLPFFCIYNRSIYISWSFHGFFVPKYYPNQNIIIVQKSTRRVFPKQRSVLCFRHTHTHLLKHEFHWTGVCGGGAFVSIHTHTYIYIYRSIYICHLILFSRVVTRKKKREREREQPPPPFFVSQGQD